MVLRNVPANARPDVIIQKLKERVSLQILECSKVCLVNDKNCAIIRLFDIEDAERLCIEWNNYKFNEHNKLKAHIHPYSYLKRPKSKVSLHPMFKSIYEA